MNFLWTAFLLGFAGSLHCSVMCGPLVLAVSGTKSPRIGAQTSSLVYNAGRIFTYLLIGLFFGFVGSSLALLGLQKWISIGAGFVLLTGLLLSSKVSASRPISKFVMLLKSRFSSLLTRRTLMARFLLGSINGLLPCGLVYAAAAGATATGSPTRGVLSMALFGAGTLPMMLGLARAGSFLGPLIPRVRPLIPATIVLLAALLLLRGLEATSLFDRIQIDPLCRSLVGLVH